MSATAVAWLSLVVNGSLLGWIFLRNSFRPSQFFAATALFSFAVRPLASEACEFFTPFYYFELGLYERGVILANVGLTVFVAGLFIGARPIRKGFAVNTRQLGYFAEFLLAIAALLDIAALQLFGTAILPGVRTTGLQQAASGSQIFFAAVSAVTVLGMGLSVLCFLTRQPGMSVLRMILRIAGFFLISMIFYQRGALLVGIVFGMFLMGLYDSRFFIRNKVRMMSVFAGMLLLATLGRQLITEVVALVEPSVAVAEQSVVGVNDSVACRIANTANQEHDQVWPTLIPYVDQYGADHFANVTAAVFRPFLSASQRDRLDLTTSVDALNIYNDSQSYLDLNFGFSISVIQYHYFSMGSLFVLSLAVAGFFTSRIENAIDRVRNVVIDARFMIRAVLVLNGSYLLNGPFDEQLKWALINSVVGLGCVAAFLAGRRALFPQSAAGRKPSRA